jgi:hypothetical protein
MKFSFNFFIVFVCLFFIFQTANAEIQRVSVGETITIGEFIYDDDYVATTTPCTVSIYDSLGDIKVNAQAMTATTTGWHYYDYAIPANGAEGSWPSFMTCGSTPGGDLIKADKTFVVKPALATKADIAAATSSIISSVKTNTDTVVENASSSLSLSLPALIWGYSARTLSSF